MRFRVMVRGSGEDFATPEVVSKSKNMHTMVMHEWGFRQPVFSKPSSVDPAGGEGEGHAIPPEDRRVKVSPQTRFRRQRQGDRHIRPDFNR